MNTTEKKGNWSQQRDKLKKQLAAMTGNDMTRRNEEVPGQLQIKQRKAQKLHRLTSALNYWAMI